MEEVPPELLLLVFVHGFKGTDNTFADFPQRLQHGLSESISNMKFESIVFPAYEVRHSLSDMNPTYVCRLQTKGELAR
jgi:hypothetical protein